MRALVALEDGLVLEGRSFGSKGERTGEVVFNTSMTGYQEILTDPSYKGQIVTMTYPHIGNYGVNEEDFESIQPHVEGFVVKEYCARPSNWRSARPLGDFLEAYGIVGIEGVDTRCITRRLRTVGAQRGIVTTEKISEKAAVEKAQHSEGMVGRELVQFVTCKEPYQWRRQSYDIEARGDGKPWGGQEPLPWGESPGRDVDPGLELAPVSRSALPLRVVAIDCGIKHNILRRLEAYGASVTVVPASWPADRILEHDPDGIVISNGPGDPEAVTYTIQTTSKLIGKRPIFGICLGHQLVALALGGKTYKLRFGHHGANQPVKDLTTGKVQITAQNHGFAVDMESLQGKGMVLTHVNLNDGTAEGMEHVELPLFSVQYHPEASPGPHDADYLFGKFIRQIMQFKGIHAEARRP